MHFAVIKFVVENTSVEEIQGKSILEVGSYNVNGSVRSTVIEILWAREYVGTDMREGPGVDMIVPAENLLDYLEPNSFDVIFCTEMLEHAEKWQFCVNNMKQLVRPMGFLYLTTRSVGFPLHDFPSDFWRFSVPEMSEIFKDFIICKIEDDWQAPGVLIKVQKPEGWTLETSADLSKINVYRMENH